ncbi:MAG TPA: hypothetical protein VMQ76_07950 [Terracidiphilus sp.]|jgi:hypothetical protein|nr:hypothetical protein [Terracidiphilus sp.]
MSSLAGTKAANQPLAVATGGNKMEWKRYQMYEDDPTDSGTWISGIYKVRSYRAGRFFAFYLRDGDKNWGDYVSTPPEVDGLCRYWPTLKLAQNACETHAKVYQPAPKSIKRAQEVEKSFIPIDRGLNRPSKGRKEENNATD